MGVEKMIIKEREPSVQLETMLALSKRRDLPNPQTNAIRQMVKGYEGEQQFDSIIKELKCECLILNDLMLKINGQTCQIDTLFISSKGVSIYEVKNYEGEFVYHEDKLKIRTVNKEISNPLVQLNRTTMLFRQLMEEQRVTLPLQAFTVFINHHFTLFQAPVNDQIVLPTMLSNHVKGLNNERGGLNKSHHRFAETLKQLHLDNLSFMTLPDYSFDDLAKGSFCRVCSAKIERLKGRVWECTECRRKDLSHNVIFDQIKDFHLLFPEKKYKTSEIYEWTGKLFSEKSIRSVLSKHFTLKGQSIASYYE